MTKVGDKVRFLNAVGGGVVTRIEGKLAYVDEDGFETPVLLRDIVTVDTDRFYGKDPAPSKEIKTAVQPPETRQGPTAPKPSAEAPGDLPLIETPDGDIINVTLGYAAKELKHLNTTDYTALLVNASNYYLYFTYLTRGDNSDGWVTRFAGVAEPNYEVSLGDVTRDDLRDMDRIALQYVAFKRDKEFALKAPVAVERPLDTTKFFKLHCFHEHEYFEEPVIAVDIVRADVPQRPMYIDSSRLEEGMRRKRVADTAPRRPQNAPKQERPKIIEVDLHAHELLDSTAGLSNSDILQVQLREARRALDANKRFKGQKIVLIHGKGEGVLRKAILDMLHREYKNCDVQDASFREYGYGATQVTIH